MLQQGYNIDSLFQEAQSRWLKPAEVLYILQNHEKYQFTQKPLQRPTSGSLFLFNKRILRFFRRDGHNWRKKKDGRTVGEAHERLKVGNVEALNCYYAHGEENPNFQRRSYWMLDLDYEHIVLVHYREITEGRASPGSVTVLSPGASSTLSPSPRSYTTNYPSASSTSDLHEPCQTLSSPASVEVSSEKVSKPNGVDGTGKFAGSTDLKVTLRMLEEQLSLDEESLKEVSPFSFQETEINGSGLLEDGRGLTKQNHDAELLPQTEEYAINDQFYSGLAGMQDPSNNFVLLQDAGDAGGHPHQTYSFGHTDVSKESLCWNELLETSRTSSIAKFQEEQISSSRRELADEQEYYQWPDFNGASDRNFKAPMLLPQEEENFKIRALSSTIENHETNSEYYPMLFDQGSVLLGAGSGVTIAQKQRFTIQAISPEWGYTNETTKVIVVGSFHCDPAESTWTCMFGDIEVPIQIIQDGVIRCEAPPCPPGKVTLCITTGNRESCSEVREFEYRRMTSSCTHCNFSQTEATKSPEELLLLVRFVQMLLSDSSKQNIDSLEPRKHGELKADDDMWGHIIEALLFGNGSTSGTVDWLMQELLKDKLLQWLASRTQEGCQQETQEGCQQEVCLLSKNEQGIMHMAAGLGYEWGLNHILSHGVGINFRDISGWTALHWAARFGREKVVAALIASGASAGAVTDPTSQDLTGKTPASIAAINGHKGLAGYLSEVDLTSHLSSLTLEESELSKGPAADQADMTVNSVSKGYLGACEDQTSLKDTLAAVRNATQAAARIQSAFRAHSFRIRQQRNAAGCLDVYGVNENDIQGLAAMSKLTFGHARDYNSAALSIQKNYRGWKGRNDFLALRQKVVKIQAHVRGYQVRKQYKVICWAVGVLDKVILRWRRKGVGLRGFRKDTEPINESEDDEDILKVFRKQKVDAAIDEAVSRVLSMVKSPDARQQYHRMLEGYRQAKAEIDNTASSSPLSDISDMEKDIYNYLQEQLPVPVTLTYGSR